MSKQESDLVFKTLNTAALSLDGSGVVVNFIDQVLTEGEKVIIGRRILIARMILNGHTYHEVNEQLQISPNTFSKVKKWLNEKMPGYESVMKEVKLKHQQSPSSSKKYLGKQPEPFNIETLKKKFPMHFLLLNIFDTLKK